MKLLPLEEGCLAILINLGEPDGTEVTLGKHLGENTPHWTSEGTRIIVHDDLWEILEFICTIKDLKSRLRIEGGFMLAQHLMRIGRPDVQKKLKETLSVT